MDFSLYFVNSFAILFKIEMGILHQILMGNSRFSAVLIHNVTCMSDCRRGLDCFNGFIDYLYTRLVSTSNYNATTDLYNSQITTAPAKPFPACYVFTSRFQATASNSGDSSASRPQVISSQPSLQNCLRTNFFPCLEHLGKDPIKTPCFE
jgi:hypothetical protein